MFWCEPVITIPTSRSKFILLTPRKKGSSLGGPLMREDHSWGSEDQFLTVFALYSAVTVKIHRNWSSRPHDWSFSLISGLCDSNCTLQCNYSQNWSSFPHEWSSLIRGPPSEDQCFMVGRYTHTVQSLYLPTTSGNGPNKTEDGPKYCWI